LKLMLPLRPRALAVSADGPVAERSAPSAHANSAGFKQYVKRGYADLGKAMAAQPTSPQ
jgi:hypothetical protein